MQADSLAWNFLSDADLAAMQGCPVGMTGTRVDTITFGVDEA